MVKYEYDAWGNHTVKDNNGRVITSGIGVLNPFRYRGYYYDTETGLYYLQTRYYDPEIGRFISQDSIEYADPETINGINLYAYCGNNPVMNVDPTGTIALSLIIGLIIGAVIGASIGGYVAGKKAYDNGARGWELFGWTLLGVICGGIVGGAIGAFAGWAAPAIGSFLSSSFTLGSFALASGGTVTVSITGGQAVAGVLGALILFSKHNPGMSNKPPVSWTNIDEGLKIYKQMGKNSVKAAEYLLDMARGKGNWAKGAGTEFNALKKWFDRIIRLMIK